MLQQRPPVTFDFSEEESSSDNEFGDDYTGDGDPYNDDQATLAITPSQGRGR
jgi:hypothetical protein